METPDSDERSNIPHNSAGEELIRGQDQFKWLSLLSQWQELETIFQRVTAAILFPAGVGQRMLPVHIVDDGVYLELIVKWPKSLVGMIVLHRRLLTTNDQCSFKAYHTKISSLKML